MALSPQEELELLQLEEEEAQVGGQTSQAAQPSQPATPPESKTRRFVRGVAKALPVAGGIAGSFVSPVAGTAAGAAAGAGLKEAILSSLGDQAPTLGEATGRVGLEAGLAAATGGLFKGAAGAARLGKALIVKPGAAEVALAGKEALINIGERGAEKLALARTTREAAKEGLIAAEEKAGLHFQSTPGFEKLIANPKKMAEFTQKIGRLAKQTPEELAQSVPSEQLQLFRKIAQEGEKVSTLSDIAKSEMRHGKDIFTQALGMKEKGMGEALGRFREADRVVSEIPGEIKTRLTSQKMRSAREVLDAKSLDRKRKVVKGLAAAAAGYLGLKSLIK